jgi:hypothetical protein
VLNTLIGEWSDSVATATSDLVFLSLGKAGWNVLLVGRYHDVLRREAGQWKFQHRRAEFITPQEQS